MPGLVPLGARQRKLGAQPTHLLFELSGQIVVCFALRHVARVGAAGDNAAMESFFSLLQKNVLDRRRWATREELRIAIVTWVERTYHRRRRQAALGRLTRVEYELIMTTTATQAA